MRERLAWPRRSAAICIDGGDSHRSGKNPVLCPSPMESPANDHDVAKSRIGPPTRRFRSTRRRSGRSGPPPTTRLPCRRSRVRVPSSALKSLQMSRCRRQVQQRWLQCGCTCGRFGVESGPAKLATHGEPSALRVPRPATDSLQIRIDEVARRLGTELSATGRIAIARRR